MSEINLLMRSALLHAMAADSHEEAIEALKVMCTRDDTAAVEKQLNEIRKLKGKKE